MMGGEKSKRNSIFPVTPRSPGNIKISPAVLTYLIFIFHALCLCSAVKLINSLVVTTRLPVNVIHFPGLMKGGEKGIKYKQDLSDPHSDHKEDHCLRNSLCFQLKPIHLSHR